MGSWTTPSDGDGQGDLVLDLSELAFIDSTGVHSFLRIAKSIQPQGARAARAAPQRRYVLELVRIDAFGIRVER